MLPINSPAAAAEIAPPSFIQATRNKEPKIDSVKARILRHIAEHQDSLSLKLGNSKFKIIAPVDPVVAKAKNYLEKAPDTLTVQQRSKLSAILKPLEKEDHPKHSLYCTIEHELLAEVTQEKALGKVLSAGIDSTPLLSAVSAHAKPRELADAFAYLQRLRMLTTENTELVKNHPDPALLVEIYVTLKKANLYSLENRTRAATHPLTNELRQAVTSLTCSNILNQWHYDLILHHQQPANIGKALSKLAKHGAYTDQYRDVVIDAAHPVRVAEALVDLQPTVRLFQPLSQENQTRIINYALNPNSLSARTQLDNLQCAGILTLPIFLQLLQEENRFLLTPEALRCFWYPMPPHRLTAEVWQTALGFHDHQNPLVILGVYTRNYLGIHLAEAAPALQGLILNGAQSTHVKSVHKSTSESATRLMQRYEMLLKEKGLQQTIAKLKEWIADELKESPYSRIVNAASACIKRITAYSYVFVDEGSQVKLRQLLALFWFAINDDTLRIGTLVDAKKQYLLALYEIQRGYNLSDTGVDTGGPDKPICAGGTFNKLIEKLVGLHPDAEQLVLTPAVATLKLTVVVKEEAVRYMSLHPDALEMVKNHGLASIWEPLKEIVTKRMFSEFENLYETIDNPDFTQLVANGTWVDLGELSKLNIQPPPALPALESAMPDLFHFGNTDQTNLRFDMPLGQIDPLDLVELFRT